MGVPEEGVLTKNEEYSTQEFWEARYTREAASDTTYEWFQGFAQLAPVLERLIPLDARVLHLGSGNSTLPEEMAAAGWHTQTCVDYSPAVVAQMDARAKTRGLSLRWQCADVFELDKVFDEASFDVAVDKGTIDVLLAVRHDKWDPPEELLTRVHSYVDQTRRALSIGGILLHVTYDQPHFRTRLLAVPGFAVTHELIHGAGDSVVPYYAYVCRRTA